MGMFDSLYDSKGNEWQTKAYNCMLETFRVGDPMPDDRREACVTYQVQIFGGPEDPDEFKHSYATVRDGVLRAVDARRDKTLPLMDYHGGPPYFPEGE